MDTSLSLTPDKRLLIWSFTILFLGLNACREKRAAEVFLCPPCGMSCDKLIFHAPGICPHCQMALIPASEQYTRSKEDQVTQLLKAYNYDTVPGLALGIIKHGELIFAKGYGSANLDYEIPNTPNSRFYIGSMAKQFTGAALVKLSSEGKIDFHAPIQTYLPDFPVYDHPITVQHIIHHTSGIRGTSSMQLIAGIEKNFEEYFSANMQYEMIKAQKSLNFIPGSEYRYSSGGYIILAKVVEAISGISFREYLNIHFFQPLGMDQTFVIDDHQEVVKDRVISYFPTHSGEFKRRSMIFDGMGDGSILTTVSDLAKWDRAFYEDALLHIPQFAARMYEVGILNSGDSLDYAKALQVRQYKGLQMIHHNGGMLGFRADMIRFPHQAFSVIVLANHASVHSTGIALKIADIYLKDVFTHSASSENPEPASPLLNRDLQSLTGKYFNHDVNRWDRITTDHGKLYVDGGNLAARTLLLPLENKRFRAYETDIKFNFEKEKLIKDYGSHQHTLIRFDPTPPQNLNELKPFEGTYYSSELRTHYQFYSKGAKFFMRVNSTEPIILFPDPTDSRINWNSRDMVWVGYAMIRFLQDRNQKVVGFEIGDNRVKGILFEKLENQQK